MQAKQIGLIILAIVVLILIALGVSFLEIDSDDNEQATDAPTEAVERFSEALRNKVIAELGQPIEGFEPFMFLRVYPGLLESDFDKVDALIGIYEYRDGELVHVMGDTQPIHSAAAAISDAGMATLLHNISSRFNVSVESESDVLEIIEAVEKINGGEAQSDQRVSITGEIVCLPHKDREGPQTLECAFGLLANSGEYYGLSSKDGGFLPPELMETNNQVKVTGTLISESESIYDIVGVINVESAEEL